MRRVDEAIREVLSDALASDLKDPRIGFVTVTDVKTSPDLRHARVYVSVLGDAERARGDARRAALGARRACSAASRGELRLKRTPTLEFVYDDTTERAMRLEAAARRRTREPAVSRPRPARRRHPRAGARRAARRRALRARHAREPRRRRARLARRRCTACCRSLGKDSLMFMSRRRVPAALRVPLLRARRAGLDVRRDVDGAHGRLPGLRQHRPQPVARSLTRARAARSSTSTTTTTTRASARSTTSSPEASCTAEIVWDLMRGLGRRRRRRRSPRRCTSGSSPTPGKFMYENTGTRAHVMAAELIDAGVDVARDLPPPVRGHAVAEARAARRARWRDVQRFDDGRLTFTRLTRDDFARRPAPRRATPRASSTTCAPSRGRRSRRSRASSSTTAATGREGLAARDRRRGRRLGHRPRGRRRRPPPGRRLHDDAGATTSSSRSCATQVAAQL